MRVLIIEDEAVAAHRLQLMLKDYDASVDLLACLDSIEESVAWLQQHEHPDVMLLDIQLADGFSFEIFKRTSYQKPVIFTTAYNEYALDAFRYFSVDYLLKPVSFDALKAALDKYKFITNAAHTDYASIFKALKNFPTDQYKERFLAKIGQRLIFIKTSEVAYFRAEDKVTYIIDKQGNKLPVDYTLEKLETVLDPRYFFRLNRKVIVSIDSIAQVKPYHNSRLMLYLKDGNKSDDMIISRERVPEFRQWAEQ
ncbi:response regulator transcription factor [Panacibacter ginsenosidivorans]|uniref:Response regulator transcription factor n=1 Tax=Panacibacter ginsenosidivorans TaxID=1813871 RepID=A0A5B8VDM6_9BACT|nr:LytTR family DNA-binding domain-containing protein [Panacibacter ginsenosidivorans]QEC69574.1 response regulator transcription factor [Panacibacter ginsenosidivorans]